MSSCDIHFRCSIVAVFVLGAAIGIADEFEQPPIEYSQSAPDDSISRLAKRLDRGEVQLGFDDQQGYLRSLLKVLAVPIESQMLVYSKTSLQRERISPRTPRAIYFNDEVYVGYCRSGHVLEISAVDPKLGAVFYTLDQEMQDRPKFSRQADHCLICHSGSRTNSVPGHLVRSLFVDPSGQPVYSAGSHSVDHTTPLANRWGGWYVTGRHGDQTHMGNLVVEGRDAPNPAQNAKGQNVTDLKESFATRMHLTPHSDIVALMVLEHQTLVHNRLTKASYTARQAMHYEKMLNERLGEPGRRLESTTRRIRSAGEDLVEAMLMVGEAELTAPIVGTSGYAERFAQFGPRDRQGRSLRDFDLTRRMFKYPCSYLIHSRAFDELPPEMLDFVWRRLWEVLAERKNADKFAHLSAADAQAIVEILRETKPRIPDYWRQSSDNR